MSHNQFISRTRVFFQNLPLNSASWWSCLLCSACLLHKALAVFLGPPSAGPLARKLTTGIPLKDLLCFPAFPSLQTSSPVLHGTVLVHLILTLHIPFPARSGKVYHQVSEVSFSYYTHDVAKSPYHSRPGSYLPSVPTCMQQFEDRDPHWPPPVLGGPGMRKGPTC